MDATLDFTRWTEPPLGVARRRWAITSTGLRLLLRGRFFRILLFLAWFAGVLTAAAGFLFCQTITPGGWLESLAAGLGPRPSAVAAAFCSLVLLYPDIVVDGLFSAIFFVHAWVGLGLSLLALTVIVPRLVTRDRASNALTIYLSRPLTSLDYLIGKFGIIVGVLLLLWTGPLLFGWFLSVLFAPDNVFVVHSLGPVGRALLFNLIALAVVAPVAFGISALSKTTAHTVLLWIGMWILLGMLADLPFSPAWLRHASFSYNLEKVKLVVFKADTVLSDAARKLPIPNNDFSRTMDTAGEFVRVRDLPGAVTGLVVLVGLSSFVFFRRLRPE